MLADTTKLKSLGTRLHDERLKRNETQATFAARIGISVPTLRKMEAGDPAVLIGYWATALELLDRAGDLDALLAVPDDLFAKYERQNVSVRKRASRGGQ
jgi:transcriptional regulator with XRE-family HTH domain